MKNNKIKAFGMTEILLTLAFVGTIAAVTIPTLMNSYHTQHTIRIEKNALYSADLTNEDAEKFKK